PLLAAALALVVGPLIGGIALLIFQGFFIKQNWEVMKGPFLVWLTSLVGSVGVLVAMFGYAPKNRIPELFGDEHLQQAGVAAESPEKYLFVDGGRIWYRKVGSGDATPVILLHGGPGIPSHYLKPFEALSDERPVVRYDQLGGGHSEHTTDLRLFTIKRYVAELDSLRR